MITDLKPEWREVLLRRNSENKVCVPTNRIPSSWKMAISELKKNGYIVWLDNTVVPALSEKGRYPLPYDVYLLTPKGTKLCEDNGIMQREI
jgi:hypothetical protein